MRTLIIEDAVDIADLLRRGFAEQGYETAIAYDGSNGLDAALTGAFDVIVLDAMLPDVDGFEITPVGARTGAVAPGLVKCFV